jgi:hypothetical protein
MLCSKGELAGSGGERFLAAGGSQLPVECSMLLPIPLEVRKNNYRSYFLTGSQNVYLPAPNSFFCWSQPCGANETGGMVCTSTLEKLPLAEREEERESGTGAPPLAG